MRKCVYDRGRDRERKRVHPKLIVNSHLVE